MKMLDLPFPLIGAPAVEFVCTEDTTLSDKDFSNKESQIAKKGDVLKLSHHENYGLVRHPVHGLFRC